MRITTIAESDLPVIWYDVVNTRMRAEAFNDIHSDTRKGHVCGPECLPPSEAEILALLDRLSPRDRDVVRFLTMLHHHGYCLPLSFWPNPPAEALPMSPDAPGKH